jgi:hypothetical protein
MKGVKMSKKVLFMTGIFCLMLFMSALAGVDWQSKLTNTVKGKPQISLVHTCAQGGNVRQEFVDVKSDNNPYMKKGTYWLYKGDSDKIIVVNPKEKTYMEVPLQSILQAAASLGQIVKMTITEPKVEVISKDKETVSGYDCNHVQVNSSYKMETKIAFMKMQTAVEQNQEIWATNDIDMKEMAATFKDKSFKSGFTELDALMEKQMQPFKNIGFVIKSITTQKNSDNKGKIETSVSQMDVTEVSTKDLDNSLFQIPPDYTQQEFFNPQMGK